MPSLDDPIQLPPLFPITSIPRIASGQLARCCIPGPGGNLPTTQTVYSTMLTTAELKRLDCFSAEHIADLVMLELFLPGIACGTSLTPEELAIMQSMVRCVDFCCVRLHPLTPFNAYWLKTDGGIPVSKLMYPLPPGTTATDARAAILCLRDHDLAGIAPLCVEDARVVCELLPPAALHVTTAILELRLARRHLGRNTVARRALGVDSTVGVGAALRRRNALRSRSRGTAGAALAQARFDHWDWDLEAGSGEMVGAPLPSESMVVGEESGVEQQTRGGGRIGVCGRTRTIRSSGGTAARTGRTNCGSSRGGRR